MCILVLQVEFQGCGCTMYRAMDQCPDAAATGSEFALCAMGVQEEIVGVDRRPGGFCRPCAVVWLRDHLWLIDGYHAALLSWATSYPAPLPMEYFNGQNQAIQEWRAAVYDWAISHILA